MPIWLSKSFWLRSPGRYPNFAEFLVAIVLQKIIILLIVSFSKREKKYPNDIIVFPDGFVAYDWDRKPISDLEGFMDLGDFMIKTFKETHEKTIQSNNQNTEKITNGYVGEYLGCGQYRKCEYLGCGVYNYSPSCSKVHC